MKKGIILFLSVCFVVLFSNAETAKEEIYANIDKCAANYYAYPTPTAKLTAAPSGYKPFYISTYARHGSRYHLNNYQLYPSDVLKKAEKNGILTSLGSKVLAILDSVDIMSNKRLGELTPKGALQHKGIANRMYHNYPEIFRGNAKIDARSTVVIRCILSMMSECLELQRLNPKLQIVSDASNYDMYYMNNSKVKRYGDAYEIKNIKKEFKESHISSKRLLSTLITNPEFVKWGVDTIKFMENMFQVAINMQSFDTNMELFSIFTKEECYKLWECSNVTWYIDRGPSPLTKGKAPYIEANLLENILNTADSCITNKSENATLRFGHESCLLPLAVLMELGNCALQISDLEQLSDKWRNYEIFPMASNIQLVFFKKSNSNDILVKALLNEKEVSLPVESSVAPYYHWKDVEKYYRKKLSDFWNQK